VFGQLFDQLTILGWDALWLALSTCWTVQQIEMDCVARSA